MNDEKFLCVIESLVEKNENIPVIVEGIRDRRALRKIGLSGEIIVFNSGESISDFSERISKYYTEVILLFDNDKRGGYLTKTVASILTSRGVKVILEFREMIFSFSEMKGVEEIFTQYQESLERKINGKRRRMV